MDATQSASRRRRGRGLWLPGTAVLMLLVIACVGASTPGSPTRPAAMDPTTGVPSPGAPGPVCRGPDVDWSGLPPIAQAYGRAWNERDEDARLQLLIVAFAEDGSYVDPTMDGLVSGRVAFAALIGDFLGGRTGEYFEPVGWAEGDGHHGHYRMAWRLCGPQAQVVLQGEDIGVLDADGRIREVTGFFAIG